MEFGVLGPLEAKREGDPIELGRPQQRAVLAVLLTQPNQTVPLDRLVDLLWGENPPSRAAAVVQGHISTLRRTLEPDRPTRSQPKVLVTHSPGYRLVLGAEDLDASRFEALAAQGHRLFIEGRACAAHRTLAEALSLWRGRALADIGDYPFAQAEAARLHELRQLAIEERLEAQLALGEHALAVAELEVLAGERPLREHLWELLMVALYRCGRQGEALRAFAQARRVLCEELGIEPGPALRQLEADILAQVPSLEWQPPQDAVRRTASVEPAPPSPGPHALVGREPALAVLVTALEQAGAGRGQLALLTGEPGIGKTRLLEELAARAAAQGTVVAWGRGYEGEGVPAFWPWVQVIDALIAQLEPQHAAEALGEGAAVLAQIAPQLKTVARQAAPLPPCDPAAARFRLCREMTGFLSRVAADQPVLVVLDDLHWADAASLELARFAATRLAGTPIMVAVAYRPADVTTDDALALTLAELARVPRLIRLPLQGLNPSEVGRLATQTTGVSPSPAVSAAIYEQTEGNPFFVVELARLLAAEGALSQEKAEPPGVPPGVRHVIRRLLARLPRATNDLLSAAAVMGRHFELAVVARAAQIDEESALEAVDAAAAAGIVSEEPRSLDGYRFSHALVQQAIYTEQPRRSRAQLHARVGEALAGRSGDGDSRAVELAHHWFQAAPAVGPERGVAAALRAAETAQARLAFEQAEEQLRRALELLERLPPGPDRSRRELNVQNRLATVLTVTHGYASNTVAEAWNRARALSCQVGATPDLVPSLWGSFTMALVRLELEAAMEVAGQLRELAPTRDDPAFRLAGVLGSALARFHRGCLVAARHDLEEAEAMCDALHDPGALADTFTISPVILSRGYLSLAYWLLGDDRRARKASDESLALAGRRHRHQYSLTSALTFDTWICILRSDAALVRRRLEQIKANRAGRQESVPLMMVLSAWARAPEDHAQLEQAHQALKGLMGAGFNLMSTLYLGFLVDAHLRAGQPEAAIATADEGLAQVEATGERFYEAELCRARAEALAARCPPGSTEAERWLRRAMAVAESQAAVGSRRRAEATLARLRREHDRPRPDQTSGRSVV